MNNMFGFSSAKDISALMRSPAVGQNLMRNSISSPSVSENLIRSTKKRPFSQASSILDLEEESDDKMERKSQPKSSPYFLGEGTQQFRKPTFASTESVQGDIRSSPKPPPPSVPSANFEDNKEVTATETIHCDADEEIAKNFQSQEVDEDQIYFSNTQHQQSEMQNGKSNVLILENEMQELLQMFQDVQEKEKAFIVAKCELLKQKTDSAIQAMETRMQIRHELVHQKLCSFYEDFEKDAKEGHALEEELIHLRCYMSDTVQKFLQMPSLEKRRAV